MIIHHFGGGSFRLQSGEKSILIDPQSNRLKADIILRTTAETDKLLAFEPGEVIFPGEYEIQGVEIIGIPIEAESSEKVMKTAYLVEWEEMKFAFLGKITKYPEAGVLEKLDDPDVLFMMIGSGGLASEVAAKVAKELEPKLIVPGFDKLPSDFNKSFGTKAEPQEKFVFKKKELGTQEVVVLKPSE